MREGIGSRGGQGAGDLGEIGSHDPPSDPSVESVLPMVQTAIQQLVVLDDADASFDAGSEAHPLSKPGLMFVLGALGRAFAGFGQHHLFDALLARIGFIVLRPGSSIGRDPIRGFPETRDMVVDALGKQLTVLGIPLLDAIVGDNASIHFIEFDFASKLRGITGLVLVNNGRMRLKETHDLFGTGYSLF